MKIELYDKLEDIEVSLTSTNFKDFCFKSEIKNLTFDFSIVKYLKVNDLLEKVSERQKFIGHSIDEKICLSSEVCIKDPSLERLEVHFKLIDSHLDTRSFYFNLGSNWSGGGRLYVRELFVE